MAPSTGHNPTDHHPTDGNPTMHHPNYADPTTDTSPWTFTPIPMTMDEFRKLLRECLTDAAVTIRARRAPPD